MLKRVLLWVFVFLLIAAVCFSIYWFFLRPVPGPSVSITFSKPDQVLVGDPFILGVTISNNSDVVLNNATLSILLPSNVSFEGMAATQSGLDQSLGDLGPGSINPEQFNLIVTGNPQSVANITAKLTYGSAASPNTQYESDGMVGVVIGQPALGLSFSTPSSIFDGQNFQTVVSYQNNTSHSFNAIQLALQYPSGFTFASASPAAQGSGGSAWNLGTIPANATGTITITGALSGPSSASYAFAGNLTGTFMGTSYALDNTTANVSIAPSPLSISVAPNSDPNYIAGLSDDLTYTVTYSNNSQVNFQNVNLQAQLTGAMFDLSTVNPVNGSFNSLNDTVSWNAGNVPLLASVAAGQSGTVIFKVRTMGAFPIKLPSDKDFTLGVNAQISSNTVPPGTDASSTMSVASASNKVGGQIALSSEGFWRDAKANILNSGPYPPKVNQATQYTIHWDITNYSTDANSVTVTASLQSGTTCTGVVTSNMSTQPSCDPSSGIITWTIPTVPATTGVTDAPAEAVIQVVNTPSVNQVGNSVTLLGPASLTATDGFTSSTLTAAAPAVTTDLPNDTSISPSVNRQVSN